MVGSFSRFFVGRAARRRTQSALDGRAMSTPIPELSAGAISRIATDAATAAPPHGIQVAGEFKPVEHPVEPFDYDLPIQCPLPEPCILNDGRIWKERVTAVRRRSDIPVMKGGSLEPEAVGGDPPRTQFNRLILPSLSAPEHHLLKLLEESGI